MKTRSKIIAAALILAVLASFSASTFAGAEWDARWTEIKENACPLAVTPGAEADSLNFCWLTSLFAGTGIEISENADMSDAQRLTVYRRPTISLGKVNFATAENLKPATRYYYRYSDGKNTSPAYPVKTVAEDSARFMFCSDPQIGRSGDPNSDEVLSRDALGWNEAVDDAFARFPDIDMILCAGDLVERAYSETQYKAFMSPAAVKTVPLATAIGNHDFYTPNYSWHFHNPNSNNWELLRSPAGNGYYFRVNDVLFIVLNSNNYNYFDQRKLMSTAVKAHPDAKFRIAMFHHSPFDIKTDEETLARSLYPGLCDEFDIDLALTGHSHVYSRSYFIKDMKIIDAVKNENGEYADPEGTVYFTANSASGSKYGGIPENPSRDYCAAANQNERQQYSIIDAANGRLSITTYSVGLTEPTDETVVIVKRSF